MLVGEQIAEAVFVCPPNNNTDLEFHGKLLVSD